MAWTARLTAPAAFVAALLAGAGPAWAAPQPVIPPEVAAVFSGDALRATRAVSEDPGTDFSGPIRADHIQQTFRFSPEFIDGVSTPEPVTANDVWIAAVVRGNEVLGVVWVTMPENGPAAWTGTAADVALGTALGRLSGTEVLVADEPNGAYYALDDSTARPLNDWASRALPLPADIADLQDVVAEQYAALREQSAQADPGEFPGQVAAVIGPVAIFVVVYGAITLLEQRRRRHPSLASPSS